MPQIRVGVVRGGPSSEYEVSLQTGASVLKHLPAHYHKEDILITKDGTWHFRGEPVHPANLPAKIDVVFNCLHGEYGEDGQIQRLLDHLGLPYTGSGPFASALGMNKLETKKFLAPHGIKMPRHAHAAAGCDPVQAGREVHRKFGPPYIVKPADRGSSVGLFVVKTAHGLPEAIAKCLAVSDSVLIEEMIRGKEATVGVLEKWRGRELYPLLPIEIVPPKDRAFDYDAKYASGETKEICPGSFSEEEKGELARIASEAHKRLGLRHYSRSDFIVSPRGIYYLETNTQPGLTNASLLPKALLAVGATYPDFLDHLVRLALGRG